LKSDWMDLHRLAIHDMGAAKLSVKTLPYGKKTYGKASTQLSQSRLLSITIFD